MRPTPSILETDPAKKMYPKYIYSRLQITKANETFFYKIDYSSGYFLRRVHLKYPSLCKDPTLPAWTPGAAVAPGAKYTPSAAWKAANPGADLILEDTGAGGITDAAEAIWPRTHNQIIIDNTVTWKTKSAYYIQCPRLNLSIYDSARNIARQPEPTPADLIGTPASEGAYLIEAPAPVDQDGYGLNFNVPNPPTISASVNFIYKYADVLKIEITGQTEQAVFSGAKIFTPNFIDLFLIGYYLPTGTLQN